MTRIPAPTPARAKQRRLYRKLRADFLRVHPVCFVCCEVVPEAQRDVHHFYGRTGALLCWVPGFRTVHRSCHDIIEGNRKWASECGYRAPENLFGRPSKVIPK